MSPWGVPHDVCDPPRFLHPVVQRIGPTGVFFRYLDISHEPVTTLPSISGVRKPLIPRIRVPCIPRIRVPFIPQLIVPVTSRRKPLEEHGSRKQTVCVYPDSQDGDVTRVGSIRLPDYHGQILIVSELTLRACQEQEIVSPSDDCALSVCSQPHASRPSSQRCARCLPRTDSPVPFAEWPDSAVPEISISNPLMHSFAVPNCAEAPNIGSDSKSRCKNYKSYHLTVSNVGQGADIQWTQPSPSVDMQVDWGRPLGNIALQNPNRVLEQSFPTREEPVKAAKPNVEHLTPRLRACLPCQIQKRKCDYGYPGQTTDGTKPHAKNHPCTRECLATRLEDPQDTDSTYNSLSTIRR